MDGRTTLDDGSLVVNLKGVPAPVAYTWGVEAGCFMIEVRQGTAVGAQVFHAGNLGMIEFICAESGLDVDVLSSENDHVFVKVSKRKHKLKVVRG